MTIVCQCCLACCLFCVSIKSLRLGNAAITSSSSSSSASPGGTVWAVLGGENVFVCGALSVVLVALVARGDLGNGGLSLGDSWSWSGSGDLVDVGFPSGGDPVVGIPWDVVKPLSTATGGDCFVSVPWQHCPPVVTSPLPVVTELVPSPSS